MKPIRHCLTIAALLIALPAVAEDKPQPPIPPTDPELMLMQIDLKTLLQHYEKLQSEFLEAELQLALVKAGALDPAAAEAGQAPAKTENAGATSEEAERARKRYSESKLVEADRLRARISVLDMTAKATREKASALAKGLAQRTEDAALIHPQPRRSTS